MKLKPIYSLGIISILLGVVYISENVNLWTLSYEINDKKEALEMAKQNYIELNTQIAQYNAIGNISNNTAVIDMESTQFVYLDKDGALVKK